MINLEVSLHIFSQHPQLHGAAENEMNRQVPPVQFHLLLFKDTSTPQKFVCFFFKLWNLLAVFSKGDILQCIFIMSNLPFAYP